MRSLTCCWIPLLVLTVPLFAAESREPSPDELVSKLAGESLDHIYMSEAMRRTESTLACEKLTAMGDAAVPALERGLASEDESLRTNAIYVLGRIRTPASLAVRLKAATSTSEKLRDEAIYTLPTWKDQAGMAAVLNALKDPDVKVRTAALSRLYWQTWQYGKLDPDLAARVAESIIPLLADNTTRRAAARVLSSLGKTYAVKPLIEALSGPGPEGKTDIVQVLGDLRDKEAVPALIPFLHSGDPILRYYAAQSLGRLADPRASDELIKTLRDPEPYVRRSAVTALGILRERRATIELIRLLGDFDGYAFPPTTRPYAGGVVKSAPEGGSISRHAAQALAQIGDPRAIDALRLYLLANPDEEYLARALAQFHDDRAIAALVQAASEKNSKAAKKVLAELYNQPVRPGRPDRVTK